MLQAGEDAGGDLTGALRMHGPGVELAALAGGEGLRSVLVANGELAVEDQHPGRELMAVQVAGDSWLVLGDADLVVESVEP